MGFGYFDYTENYNFSKELDYRKNYARDGEVIGEVELGNEFYAELVKNGGISGVTDRIMVWLCHREHKEKVYAFTMMEGAMLHKKGMERQDMIRMKFAGNYAKLTEAYAKRYCKSAKR